MVDGLGRCPDCGTWTYGYETTAGFQPAPHYCNRNKTEKITVTVDFPREIKTDFAERVLRATEDD